MYYVAYVVYCLQSKKCIRKRNKTKNYTYINLLIHTHVKESNNTFWLIQNKAME